MMDWIIFGGVVVLGVVVWFGSKKIREKMREKAKYLSPRGR